MNNTYLDLIDQTYKFPQEGFELQNSSLHFHRVSLKHLIDTYGTPFQLTYLPRIGEQINKAKNWFEHAIASNEYDGKYYYCYCIKSCQFEHVINKALEFDIHLETSSEIDTDLVLRLHEQGKINQSIILIHNGYKTIDYLKKIIQLNEIGFKNAVTVLDSMEELERLDKMTSSPVKIGIRLATDLPPQSPYYTSRLGIRSSDIISFYKNKIAGRKKVELKMLHFFVDSGIVDNLFYWGEFQKALKVFIELKRIAPSLDAINIGGGFPIKNKLNFDYDYEHIIGEIVRYIKEECAIAGIQEPDIFTEFGKFSVGESGAVIFEVLQQKRQNDQENWYIINNSLMNTIPDAWSILEKFILLPVNKWNNKYEKVNIGGISCDYYDFYNSEDLNQQIFLPTLDRTDEEPLYIGFFHTGAYQDAISGYGGITHCLIPSPKHIIVDRDEAGNITSRLYRAEQNADDMLGILGY